MMNIFDGLSEEQKDAIQDPALRKCILASAGSGKTGTLVSSIVNDLINGIEPGSIVAFTFTEKAAAELVSRVTQLSKKYLPEKDIASISIGTIHSWCHQYLRNLKDYHNFDSLDELQLDTLVSRLYDYLELEKFYGRPFPRAIEPFLEDLEIFYNENLQISDTPIHIQEPIEKFLSILRDNKLLTFGGMIRYTYDELIKTGPVSSLSVLYVDEYQDVNSAQVSLIENMISDQTKLVVVGDDLQCIYNWRGSDVSRILSFSSDFPNSVIKRLSSNYRSRPAICEFGNIIAREIKQRDSVKTMKSQRSDDTVDGVYWLSCTNEKEEVGTVVEIVKGFVNSGVRLNQITILLRSVINSGQEFREALMQEGFQVNCPILSRAKDFVMSFLIPLFQWIQIDITEPRNEQEEEALLKRSNELWNSSKQWISESDKASELVFWKEVDNWKALIKEKRSEAYNIRGLLYDLLDKIGITTNQSSSDLIMGLSIASQIIRSVEEVHRRRLYKQERRTPRGLISEVILSLKRHVSTFGESQQMNSLSDGILITTIHQAKGLEWPIVILPRLRSRKFPVQTPPKKSSFTEEINLKYSTKLDDEYRLFYVASTRAQERLFISDPCQLNPRSRSVFLKNLESTSAKAPLLLSAIRDSTYRPIIEGKTNESPLHIGISDLLIYLACPYQYALSKVARIQPAVGDELGYGKGLHEIIQRRLEENQYWDDRKIRQETDDGVHLPLMSHEDEQSSKRTIANRIRKLQDIGVFNQTSTPEVSIAIEVGTAVVTGIIDGISEVKPGEYNIRDWKSSIHDEFLVRYEKQMQFYAYAVTKKGGKVLSAELVDVSASHKEGQLVTRQVDVSSEHLKSFMGEAEAGIQGIRNGEFEPKSSSIICKGCDMRRICHMNHKS